MQDYNSLLKYNLQYFAKEGEGGEKTEDATQKKIDDSRKEGQVARSRELVTGVSMLAMFLCIKFCIGFMGERFINAFSMFFSMVPTYVEQGINSVAAHALVNEVIIFMMITMLPFLIVGLVVGFLANKVQFKWMITTKPLQPKFNKLNPMSGFKRMFSKESLMEFVKSIAKVVLISYIVYSTIIPQANLLYKLYDMSIEQALELLYDIVMNLGFKVSGVLLAIGAGDFLYQRWKHKQDLKMTKQEVKDEYKNTEGDPKVKSKQKQRMMQASQRRMMQSIPEADVVITNPTHFAVALKYDANTGKAPVVVAKGADFLASKIKEIAKESQVEIVENKPLARMLYYNVDLNNEIPVELYQMVADVLAYVYKIKNKVS